MTDNKAIEETVHRLVRDGFEHTFGAAQVDALPSEVWRAVTATGTTLWLDTGDMDEATSLWNSEFKALTTNNTLLNKEVQKGIYDKLVGKTAAAIRAAAPGIDEKRLILEVAFVLNAYHALRLVHQFDAFVSVELHTDLANDVERTVAYGKRFYAICPERFIVKVPLTPAGLLGARRLGDAGIPVNFTLGFSARQNYLSALVAQPQYVNVFMGRLNAFVIDNKLGDGKNVGEKATLATQREILALRSAGRTHARLIGASMRDGGQVGALAGLDVYTMPPKVASQYQQNPLKAVSSRIADDPPVTTASGVSADEFAARTLWETPGAFKACVDALLARNPSRMSPDELVSFLAAGGFGDLFPRWTEEDIGAAQTDGKIPVYARWKARLASGAIGLDSLMNLSAFYSFCTDQNALDSRIAAGLR
ncbi:MAG: transaldolase [Candidatus Hydrogenedentes bacterium]|nr:transaldolase [Candidatus Hydrogenedentota bacterium]